MYSNRQSTLLSNFNNLHKLKKFKHISIKDFHLRECLHAMPRRRRYEPSQDLESNIYLNFDLCEDEEQSGIEDEEQSGVESEEIEGSRGCSRYNGDLRYVE